MALHEAKIKELELQANAPSTIPMITSGATGREVVYYLSLYYVN